MPRKHQESLTDRAANAIVAMIATEHRFAPGDRLPNEMDLAEELGVSRITLRGAVRSLCTRGILEVHQGKGTFVLSDDPDAMPSPASAGVDMSGASKKELLELRLALEPMSAANAARGAEDKERKEIEGLLLRMEELHEKGESFVKEEDIFHAAVVRAGGNRIAAQIAVRCPACGDVSFGLSSGEDAAGILGELREVVQRIKERDPGGAKAAMRLHLLRAFQSEGVE